MEASVIFALVGPAVAAAVGWVGWENHKLARDTLREKLFQQRFAIYKQLQIYLSAVLEAGRVPRADNDGWVPRALVPVLDGLQMSRFFFGAEITTYIEKIYKTSIQALAEEAAYKEFDAGTPERKNHVALHSEKVRWLTDQLDQLHSVFMPYLRIATKS